MAESSRPEDQTAVDEVLDAVVIRERAPTIRVGISGAPGAGKSTLIEALGQMVVAAGHRLAVLAIDPSSDRTGGSILGDKTRMPRLSADSRAFVRPSPAGATRGGIARATGAAVILCEAAGFDVVIVETVGVGQNETAVGDITDLFVLLVGPAAGDDLQGIKRGVMELADIVVVTKHDGPLRSMSESTAAAYSGAMSLLRTKHAGFAVPTLTVSALTGESIDDLWNEITNMHYRLVTSGLLESLRSTQAEAAFWAELTSRTQDDFRQALANNPSLVTIVGEVSRGKRHPRSAATEFWKSR